MTNRAILCGITLLLLFLPSTGLALDGDGQQDLDKAMQLKIAVKRLADLTEVAKLCESAIGKGLDPENEKFARMLLTGALFGRAEDLCKPIFDNPEGPDERWPILRQIALPDLQKVVKYDPSFGEAYLLIAKLESLPKGNMDAAKRAVEQAAKVLVDDQGFQSNVALQQCELETDPEKQLAILDRALDLDPENVEAWKARAEYYRAQHKFEKAIEDFNRILEKKSENPRIRLAVAEALANLGKLEESMAQIDKAIELKPMAIAYRLRAQINVLQNKPDEAIKDLETALSLNPNAPPTSRIPLLMQRARLYFAEGRIELALADVDSVLTIRPGSAEALGFRSLVYWSQKKEDLAIADIDTLAKQDPGNLIWKLQLATLINANNQPRKAIALFNEVLEKDRDNLAARQGRGDALLSIGDHEKALADYDVVIKKVTDDSSVLNNLAWVLATSPNDAVRDGERALEYALKACEVTKYQEAHILSTLAAAYAEKGDFDSAVQWSQKAVDLSDESTQEQLKQELVSYKQKKPWRERQEIKDKE